MEHPYRVHSSIGFGFLQLLMLSSLAYPSPPPPLYHNIALARMMGTVYFTLFQDKPFYLKLECATILLEVIRDGLYIWYIIRDYTYVFGAFDIVSNLLFCTVVGLSLSNKVWKEYARRVWGVVGLPAPPPPPPPPTRPTRTPRTCIHHCQRMNPTRIPPPRAKKKNPPSSHSVCNVKHLNPAFIRRCRVANI